MGFYRIFHIFPPLSLSFLIENSDTDVSSRCGCLLWVCDRIATLLTSRLGNCGDFHLDPARSDEVIQQKVKKKRVDVASLTVCYSTIPTVPAGVLYFLQEVSGSVEAACGLGLADVPRLKKNPASWKRIRSFLEMLIDA